MKALLENARWLCLLALVLMTFGLSGCASTDDNTSVRPWASPMGWENGLPSTMTEGR